MSATSRLKMYRGDLLIDGYNVLHAADLARKTYGQGDFERARRDLLRLISRQLIPRERRRTTVVFDARDRTIGPSPPQVTEDLLVMFADEDGDADATIERLIRQNSAPRRLCVVSSDHRLQKAARRRRAKFVDSDVFLRQLSRRLSPQERQRKHVEPAAKRSGRLPPGEVEAWLRVFEGIDEVRSSEAIRGIESGSDRPSEDGSHDVSAEEGPPAALEPDDSSLSLSDEIDFWESRVSELWDTDSS